MGNRVRWNKWRGLALKINPPKYDEPVIGCGTEMMDIGLVNCISGAFFDLDGGPNKRYPLDAVS